MSALDDELYRRLEVGPRATHDEVVRAYRRLAHGAHPDTHPEDPDASRRFRELTEAYDVLADPSRRARYDRDHLGDPAPSPRSAVGPAIVADPGPLFVGSGPLRAGPVRIDPDPGTEAAPAAGEPEPIGAVIERLLFRLIDQSGLR